MDSTENPQASTLPHHSKRRIFWLLLAVPVALAAGVGVFKAQAAAAGFGFGAGDSPEQHKAFMERRLDKALGMVKASDSQRTAIKAIFERAFAEMRPIHQEHRRLHDDLLAAFAADPVDRAGVEKLRVQVTGLVDRGSQVLSKALLDAAGVLTAEQRQTLVQHLQELHGRGHGHL
jgi:Spy/CpxP family protein refolding chaperone